MGRTDRLFADVYFGIQRLRHGVDRARIAQAAHLLEQPWADLKEYACHRLRALYGPDVEHEEWLANTPLSDRATLAPKTLELHRQRGRMRAFGRVEWRRTSGSTGTPFSFPKDVEMTGWMDAAMWAVYRWHGIVPGERQVRFWGAPAARVPRRLRQAKDRLLNRRRVDAFRLQPGRTVRLFRRLVAFRPAYAYGYPTLLRMFAEQCARCGFDVREIGLRTVITTGELLMPDTRRTLTDCFGCPIVNEYGCTESGVLAIECEHGTPHVVPIAALPEVVDVQRHNVPAGAHGEVVVSDLYGGVLPLLRYRLHDRARWSASSCSCGRELPTLHVDSGRLDDFILTPRRGPIYDAILAYTVPPGVQRFRVRQVALDRLEAEIIPGTGFDKQVTPEACQRGWEDVLGPGMHVHVEVVAEIPLEASGKLRYFVPLEEIDRASVASG